jgi:hypothetical protein
MTTEQFKEKTGYDFDSLIDILKSESVYSALRFAYKNPSTSGIDDCEDNCNFDLYQICINLTSE